MTAYGGAKGIRELCCKLVVAVHAIYRKPYCPTVARRRGGLLLGVRVDDKVAHTEFWHVLCCAASDRTCSFGGTV